MRYILVDIIDIIDVIDIIDIIDVIEVIDAIDTVDTIDIPHYRYSRYSYINDGDLAILCGDWVHVSVRCKQPGGACRIPHGGWDLESDQHGGAEGNLSTLW